MGSLKARRGFVLIVSVIMLLSLTVITTAFVTMLTARIRSASSDFESEKALWLAEAGIQQVVHKVLTDEAYRNTPVDITGSLGGGTYTVSVVKQTETVYNLTSSGVAGGVSRDITQTATFVLSGWPRQFADYGAFTGVDGVLLNTRATINGDVYTLGSVTTVGKNSSVTGTVYADTGSGNYKRLPLPDPLLDEPKLDTTYYDALIDKASTYPGGNKTYTTLDLSGGTVYVNGRVTAANIIGPGTVVSTGNFTVGSGTVGENVTIVSNASLSVLKNSNVKTGAVLYASSSVTIPNNNVVIDNASLITPGTVTFSSKVTYNGIIFCGGDLNLSSGNQNTVITGAVVSGGRISMAQSDQIVQSSDQLPVNIPLGIEVSTISSVTLSDWQGS